MKKKDLPEKICVVCRLPFKWRKKWEKSWENAKYCSERCRRSRPAKNQVTAILEVSKVKAYL